MPNKRPSLFRRPALVVGTPVALATFRFVEVTPKARFQLKDKPGILKDFFATVITSIYKFLKEGAEMTPNETSSTANLAPDDKHRAIEIVVLANKEQVKKILDILFS